MEKNPIAKKRERSSANPAVSLKQAVDLVKKLQTNNGPGPYDRKTAAKGLGYSGVSGPSASRIAALAHYGLLSKKGGAYSLTSLAKEMLFPKEENQAENAIIKAAQTPHLYKQLIIKLNSRALPKLLNNILIQDFGISTKVAEGVAETFKESMEFAGLLKDGVLNVPLIDDDAPAQELSADVSETKSYPTSKDVEGIREIRNPVQDGELIPIELSSGIKILFPKKFGYKLSTGKFAAGIEEIENTAVKENKENGNEINNGSN